MQLIDVEKQCEYCGKYGRGGEVHEHHLYKRSIRPDLINSPDNKMDLCALCHALAHRSRKFELQLREQFYGKTRRARANATPDALGNGFGNADDW